MGAKATNVDEQIEKFKNRGMEIDMPVEKVKEILVDIEPVQIFM